MSIYHTRAQQQQTDKAVLSNSSPVIIARSRALAHSHLVLMRGSGDEEEEEEAEENCYCAQ